MCFVQSAGPLQIWADLIFSSSSPRTVTGCFGWLQTPSQALISVSWECSKFCTFFFFFLLQTPGLTVNQLLGRSPCITFLIPFICYAAFQIYAGLYSRTLHPGLSLSQHFEQASYYSNKQKKSEILAEKLCTISKRPFTCNLRITSKPSHSRKA